MQPVACQHLAVVTSLVHIRCGAKHFTKAFILKIGRGNVTINQVAKAAGVARSSVSRAFNKPHMLSPETVDRVKAVAVELGYTPNHMARALSTGRVGNLAMIVSDVANPFFPPMIRGAQDAADQADLCVMLGNSNEDPKQEDKLVGRFIGQVEGVILASSRMPEKRVREYAETRPVVLINRDMKNLPRILIDCTNGMSEAVQHLSSMGHKKIVYLSGPIGSWSNTSRRAALQKACSAFGVTLICLPKQVPNYEAGMRMTDKLLKCGATAAIAFDDLTAHGLLDGLKQRGVRIPEDISIIGCDDVLGSLTSPPLTSISNRSNEAGALAVSLLTDMLQSNAIKEARYALDTHLVVRASTGPAAS